MKRKVVSLMLAAVMAAMTVTGCGASSSKSEGGDKDVIRVGVRDTSEAIDLCKDAIKEAGYEIEVTVFDDSIQPNVALAEGSIDINWYQHEPYMTAYNEENGTDFVMVEPKTAAPLFAMYSDKWDKVSELPDGATIGLCNDSSNQARGLRMLEAQGLIKLDASVETPTYLDIKENPHNFEFIQTDMQILPQSLADVDAICLAAAHMVNAGLDATDYVCASSDADVYAVGWVVTAENKDAEWASGLAKAVQCDALAGYYATEKNGTMVPMWK